MSPNTMRTLAEYIHELRHREYHRDHNGTDSQPAFDTTIEDDAHWNPGNQDGDAGHSKNHSR
jgi:hypothetical protein